MLIPWSLHLHPFSWDPFFPHLYLPIAPSRPSLAYSSARRYPLADSPSTHRTLCSQFGCPQLDRNCLLVRKVTTQWPEPPEGLGEYLLGGMGKMGKSGWFGLEKVEGWRWRGPWISEHL